MSVHEHYMALAIEIAELGRGQTTPNPLVGAIIVKNGVIVGQGAHLRAGEAHAEVHALRMAGARAKGATVYVTLEPCSHHGRTPPCADALIAAGVARVVIAQSDPNELVGGRGIQKLLDAGIEVITGVLQKRAEVQNEAFFSFIRTGRPFIVWKCASTLDGYIATDCGHSQFVTSEDARAEVARLRHAFPAIAVGIGTVLADNPRLTVRLPGDEEDRRQPIRIVFDSHGRIPSSSRMFAEKGETWVYTTRGSGHVSSELEELCERGKLTRIETDADDDGRIHLPTALQDLGTRGISSVLVEGGSALVSSLFGARCVDKVVYYIAPKVLGGGIPALRNLAPATMQDAVSLHGVTMTPVGTDFRMEGYPIYT